MSTGHQAAGALDIPVRTDEGPARLSFGQELLWLIDRAFPGTTVWNVSRPYRVRGPLDVDALQRAFDALAARHDALRTVFVSTIEGPRQVVRGAHGVPIRHVDLSTLPSSERVVEADRLAQAEGKTPFDLAVDTPLRVLLVQLAPDDRLLCITTHHIVSDGWSKNVMFRDLSSFYAAFREGAEPLGIAALPIGWSDYADWERSDEHQVAIAEGLAYWREQLRDAPPTLDLPTDRVRPRSQGFHAARSAIVLPQAFLDRLMRAARGQDVTLYMWLLAAYTALLHRYSGQDDVVVGSPVAGRMYEETEALIGFFANTLVLRTRLEDDPSFAALLARVRETCLDAYDHQEIPVEQLVIELQKDRQLTFAPLYNVILTMEEVLSDDLVFPGAAVELLDRDERATKFDLTLYAIAVPDGLQLTLWYRTDLFAGETADRMLAHLQRLLGASVDEPSLRVSALPLLSEAELHAAARPPAFGAAVAAFEPVHVQFAAAAARTPDAVALVDAGGQLTYAQADRRAEALAATLRRRGAAPGTLVGLGLERSVDALVGLLGILKAGAAYVPLVPDLPPARSAQQIAQSELRLCVTTAAHRARFPAELETVLLDEPADESADPGPSSRDTSLDDLAYVIFTSGSTGVPKGVAVTHRNLAAYTAAICDRLAVSPAEPLVFASVTSLAADLGNTAIFPALTSGGTLQLVPPEATIEAAAFGAWTGAHPIDVLKITPGHLAALLGAGEEARRLPRRWLVLGGEACPWELVERVQRLGHCRILNHYGPTEATVGACAFEVTAVPPPEARPATVPIGTQLADAAVYVLDKHGELVPTGVPGELFIGGSGVARGYLGQPALSDERFVADPFAGAGARMYRTGDRVRRHAGGELEFLGRLDDQVKVRGYRVELGEIERVLLEHPAAAAAAVILAEGGAGESTVVAYAVPREGESLAGARTWLAERLPEYMLPAAIVELDRLPLTANGKVDRQALPDPGRGAGAAFVAPRTPTETTIASIWADVLGVERVGVTTDFLSLGFHSILAIRALDTLGQAFGIRVPIRSFFESSTVEELAIVVDEQIAGATASDVESALAMLEGMSDDEVELLVADPGAHEGRR